MSFEKIEGVFFNVLEDMSDYLYDITLVGGWLPYIYSNYLWKIVVHNPVTTVDIDFGVDQSVRKDYAKTIFEKLSSLNYQERHLQMDRMYPVVLYKEKMPVEFITYPTVDIKVIEKMVGKQMQINKIDKFDFLLKNQILINIQIKKKNKNYTLNCPKPSAFLYHKAATFIDRENKEKQAKDLYYMYFILRYAPDIDVILKEISEYNKKRCLPGVFSNINKYFKRISSQGCLLVEKENGLDEFIYDVRQDIFDRFKQLREVL